MVKAWFKVMYWSMQLWCIRSPAPASAEDGNPTRRWSNSKAFAAHQSMLKNTRTEFLEGQQSSVKIYSFFSKKALLQHSHYRALILAFGVFTFQEI